MLELVDKADSKSVAVISVWVRVPLPAPRLRGSVYMPSDAWWVAQERLHRRLQAASELRDDDEREEAREMAWKFYNNECDMSD